MQPSSWDKQLGLAAKPRAPSWKETGLDASHHIHVSREGRGRIFFLTSSFIGSLTVGAVVLKWGPVRSFGA